MVEFTCKPIWPIARWSSVKLSNEILDNEDLVESEFILLTCVSFFYIENSSTVLLKKGIFSDALYNLTILEVNFVCITIACHLH